MYLRALDSDIELDCEVWYVWGHWSSPESILSLLLFFSLLLLLKVLLNVISMDVHARKNARDQSTKPIRTLLSKISDFSRWLLEEPHLFRPWTWTVIPAEHCVFSAIWVIDKPLVIILVNFDAFLPFLLDLMVNHWDLYLGHIRSNIDLCLRDSRVNTAHCLQ